MTHVGGFGSFLWKCYRRWQTLPLDAARQASKPPSHVQRGSLLLPARGSHGAIRQVQGEWEGKGALGSSVCVLVLVYGAATSRKYGEIKLWSYFLLLSPLVDDTERILHLYTKEVRHLWEIHLHYTSSVQMHNIQSSIC